MNKLLLPSAALGLAISGLSFAAAAPMAAPMYHWYVGVGLNHYAGTTEDVVHTYSNGNEGYAKLSKSKLGYNLFVGNRVTQHFGTELGLNFLGDRLYKESNLEYAGASLGSPTVIQYSKAKNAWNVYYDGIFTLPVYQGFSVYGKAGVNYFNTKIHQYYTVDGTVYPTKQTNYKFRSFGWNYGGGIQFAYNQFGIRGDYTHMNFTNNQQEDFDTPNLVGVDVFYAFA